MAYVVAFELDGCIAGLWGPWRVLSSASKLACRCLMSSRTAGWIEGYVVFWPKYVKHSILKQAT